MRAAIVSLALVLFSTAACASERVETLLRRMTLEEKIGQLIQLVPDQPELRDDLSKGMVGSVLNTGSAQQVNELQRAAVAGSRHRIPLLVGHDVIHGYRTIFPIPLGLASSWDAQLVEETARIAAKESRAAGIHWTFAPMLDIARDPRWGRIAEGQGEDPFLASILGAAYVKGFQGDGGPDSILACAKHFAGYGAAVGGRDYGETEISEATLREVYLPPFRAAADAGVATFMTAFNTVDRVPATANRYLLDQILRREWRYRGMVGSDWAAVAELINHGIAASPAEAARKAITSGVDMDMWDRTFLTLTEAVREGRISERVITDATRRVLEAKERAGVLDRPFADEARSEAAMVTPANRAVALRSAQRSIVLLKNDGAVLPLTREGRRIAVIGPLAGSRADLLGPWAASGKGEETVSVVDALRAKKIAHTAAITGGVAEVTDDDLLQAVELARDSDVVIAIVGETRDMSGEAASRSSLDLPGRQQQLLDLVATTGKPIVTVVLSGRPLAITRAVERSRAVLQAWFPGTEGGNAIVDLLFGEADPVGRLPVTIPRSVGQVPIFYAQLPSGRPAHPHNRYSNKYSDIPIEPLFPFGFGLTYTRFEYGDLQVSSATMRRNGSVTISASMRNAGARRGEEVVQLYIRDRVASVSRPVRELKAFRRVSLSPGETTRVEFVVTARDLEFWSGRSWIAEPGAFDVWIAPDAASGLKGTFELVP